MLAVPYSRISTAGQTAGLGLERQAADPVAYCAARGWQLYDGPGYSDAGRSAFGGANLQEDAALGRFLADLRGGRFGPGPVALLVEDLDRFSRSFPLSVLPVIVDDVLNAGVTISVTSKGRDISRASIQANPMELHELLFWLSSAHEFSARLSRRLSHVHQVKRGRVRDGQPVTPAAAPFWIDWTGDAWTLNQHATTVRRILELAREQGGTAIAALLNAEAVPSPAAIRHQRAGTTPRSRPLWNGPGVLRVIESPAIHGARPVLTPGNKARIRAWREDCALLRRQGGPAADMPPHPPRLYEPAQPGYYPAILDEAEHQQLLALVQARRQKPLGRTDMVRWIGAGLTFCTCGELIGATGSSRGGGPMTRYLRCRGRHRGSGCSQPTTPLPLAQAAVLTRLAADDYLAMLEARGGASRSTAHSQALAQRDAAAQALEQAQAVVAAGEAAMASVDDPAVLVVLARRQAAATAALEAAEQQLAAATLELQQLQGQRSIEALGAEAQQTIRQLLHAFSRGADTVDDRRLVHGNLRRLGLRITINATARALGLQLGGGPIDWQPMDPELTTAVLAAGATGATFCEGDEQGVGAWAEWPA